MNNNLSTLILDKKIDIGDRCIYCGGVGTTDEHIVPKALGGTVRLSNASCESCRVITSKYERNPLHDIFAEARASLNYPSRKRKLNEETFPLEVTLTDGSETTLMLTQNEIAGLAIFIEYSLPGFFDPVSYPGKGINVVASRLVAFNDDTLRILKDYKIQSFKRNVLYRGNHFENMLARIAYTFVVGCWGVDALEEVFVLPALLGKKDDIGLWVGCDIEGRIVNPIGNVSGGTAMKIGSYSRGGHTYAVVTLKLFSNSPTPEYIVVVGRLSQTINVPEN